MVLNCVGPYRFLGERVVRACVDSGASHIDISGEEQFIASMHLKYDDRAKEKDCYIIRDALQSCFHINTFGYLTSLRYVCKRSEIVAIANALLVLSH